ncbi:hypothetical protein [Frondihabitans australicus]|uniref:Uncharacterized protein n=1 Tax=Frondihabitans australicus TaxID=386892 RepID=A0A495IKY6_9MICO|nr:hypothetical protein [Frondihabitans australicus]RKR75941.1 hypothetical protein C8E83_3105 [Frondihabitans australicus]
MTYAYKVVHRRNHAAPGVVLIIAGLGILIAAILPLIQFTGPGVTALARGIGMTLTNDGAYEPDPWQFSLWVGGTVFVLGFILLATRIRGLGALWRILALLALLAVGVYVAFWWFFLSDPSRFLASQDQSLGGQLKSGITSLLEGTGAYSITPGIGLLVASIAAGLGIIGVFLPAGKTENHVPLAGSEPYPQQPYPGQQYPGQQQYPTQGYPQQQYPGQYPPGQFPPTGQ